MTILAGTTTIVSGQTHARTITVEGLLGRKYDVEGQFKRFPGYSNLTAHPSGTTNADITYTAKTAGSVGDTYTVQYVDPGVNGAESVAVTAGIHIVVTLARSGGVITSTGSSVLATLIANSSVMGIVSVKLGASSNGTGVLAALPATKLKYGSLGLAVQTSSIVAEGRTPLVTLDASVAPGSYSLADDANLYPVYVQMWQDILDACYPTSPYVRVHLEMNAPGAVKHYMGLASDFIPWYRRVAGDAYTAGLAAYRAAHVGDAIRLAQTCIRIWTPTALGAFTVGSGSYAPPFYPGDDVVDRIAADTYNRGTTTATWVRLVDLIEPWRVWARTNSRGVQPAATPGVTNGTKQIAIAEIGSVENSNLPGGTGPNTKAQQWVDLKPYLTAHTGDFELVNFTDTQGDVTGADDHVDSSPASFASYKTLVTTFPFGSGTPPPPPTGQPFAVYVNGSSAHVTEVLVG